VCGRASESTIIDLIIPGSATGILKTFDICRFQGVTALALTTLWKPWAFAIKICGFSFVSLLIVFYCRWRLIIFKMANSESSTPLILFIVFYINFSRILHH
jgi:hypothetical protein